MTDKTPVLHRGCDAADIDGMARNAKRIKAAGLDFVWIYLKATTTLAHIAAIRAAGLAIGAVFEAGAANALGGAAQGKIDGNRARQRATALGFPADIPIFPAVDVGAGVKTDIDRDGRLDGQEVAEYFGPNGFNSRAGYIDGELAVALSLQWPWGAGAMGWPGSRDYYANGPWVIWQGTPTRGGSHQLGFDWPDLGFEYDPDVARNLDWAWQPPGVVIEGKPLSVSLGPVTPKPAANVTDMAQTIAVFEGAAGALQTRLKTLGYYKGAIDSDPGPATRAALAAYRAAHPAA